MQKIHQLHQGLLGLVLPRHVGKAFASLGLHIYLGITLAKGHGVTAHALAHKVHEQLPQGEENEDGQDPVFKEADNGRILFRYNLGELNLALHQSLGQLGVLHTTGHINLLFLLALAQGSNTLVRDFYLRQLALVHHLHEAIVGHIMHLRTEKGGHNHRIDKHNNQQGHDIIIQQGPLFIVITIHRFISFNIRYIIVIYCTIIEGNTQMKVL